MFNIGDVIRFHSSEAGKRKFHLCISMNGQYLFLNSAKLKSYPSDYIVPASEFPFLPQDTPDTIISCSLVLKKSNEELRRCGAKCLGSARRETLLGLIRFIEKDRALPEAVKDEIFDGLGDWI
jgi:hypothetical protein